MKSCVEYVWIGGNHELRSKTKVIELTNNLKLSDLPIWNYDGSSTDQASGEESEILIYPRCLFNDPFRKGGSNYLVMCDTYYPDGKPHVTNRRYWANELFNQKLDEKPWFGLEQEYFLFSSDTNKPLGFPNNGLPNPQGQYYCSCGSDNSFGREVADEHLKCCIDANIKISGINAEVAPGQWEFQIGPCLGIEQGDHLWMARYLLHRVAEKYNFIVNFEPKPMEGDWNGSGCHTNYSTEKMRNENGLECILESIQKLSNNHDKHMELYGTGNEKRMTGKHETASFNKFTYDIANRGCSVRIGNETNKNKRGYFEDRRPSSNCDPYNVTGIIFKTTVLDN